MKAASEKLIPETYILKRGETIPRGQFGGPRPGTNGGVFWNHYDVNASHAHPQNVVGGCDSVCCTCAARVPLAFTARVHVYEQNIAWNNFSAGFTFKFCNFSYFTKKLFFGKIVLQSLISKRTFT